MPIRPASKKPPKTKTKKKKKQRKLKDLADKEKDGSAALRVIEDYNKY